MTETPVAVELHGVRVALVGDAELASAAHERLAALPSAAAADADITIRFVAEPPPETLQHDQSGRNVYESRFGAVRYVPSSDELRLARSTVGLQSSGETGEATIWVDAGCDDAFWLASRPLLSLVLFDLLRRHGLYVVHAAAAAAGDRAVLLAGDSGRGKSTLALALAREGMPLLGDDIVFLSGGAGESLVAHGLPEPIDLAADGARLFPELPALRAETPRGWPKHRVPIDVFGSAPAAAAVPAAVVFLDERDGGRSAIEPLPEAEGLLRLAPNVLLTHVERSQQHLNALGRLLETARCFRLRPGDDPAETAAAVRALV